MDSKTTTQPYPPGTRWTVTNRNGYTQTTELCLYAEPNYSTITDDYTPDEINAHELWRIWIDKVAGKAHEKWPDQYRPGEVTILWTLTAPAPGNVHEAAPHTRPLPPDPDLVRMFGRACQPEDFLTHFRVPTNADTGERINWLRLPVLDLGWNATTADSGGFIQEVTGWKPSPLQPTMDVVQLGRAAGLYVPDLG